MDHALAFRQTSVFQTYLVGAPSGAQAERDITGPTFKHASKKYVLANVTFYYYYLKTNFLAKPRNTVRDPLGEKQCFRVTRYKYKSHAVAYFRADVRVRAQI